MRELTKTKAILYLAAIFLVGAAAGAVFTKAAARRHNFKPPTAEEMAVFVRAKLKTDLNLTADQVVKIDPIILQTCSNVTYIHQTAMNQTGAAIKKSHLAIAEFLTPEQKARLEQLERDREAEMNRHLSRPTNAPGPPK